MFYIFLTLHILLLLESYFLFLKKKRRKSMCLFLLTVIMLIFNVVRLYPTITNEVTYSSVIYIKYLLNKNAIFTIFWMLLNFSYFGISYYIIHMMSLKKKQNTFLKILIYSILLVLTFFFLIVLFNNIAALLLLLSIISTVVYLLKLYIKGKQNYILASIIIILVFAIYSYGFYTGAARLQIALQGYPIEAYNTGLEELKFFKEENMKKYMPIQELPTDQEDIGMIQVKNYFGIKIGTYYKY